MNLETFFEKFDLFTDCPNAVQKMRELILELAVQGKLVEQGENEERIDLRALASNRAMWLRKLGMKEKLVRGPKKNALSEVPSSWQVLNFGLLGRAQAGFAFNSSGFTSDVAESVPIIRIRDIHSGVTQTNFRGEFRPEFLVDQGDYLIGMDGNFTIAKWRGGRALLNQRVTRLQWFSELIVPSYVVIALQKRLRELQGVKAYTTVDHLSTKQIEEAWIPLPPLAEQKRIVAKVDGLMALCDALEAQQQERETKRMALAKASLAAFAEAPSPQSLELLFHPAYAIDPADLRKSILTLAVQGKLVEQREEDEGGVCDLKILGKGNELAQIESNELPFDLPQNWKWCRLGWVAELLNGDRGKNYPNREEYVRSGVPWINTGHIEPDGSLSLETMNYLTREKYNSLRSGKILKGDLVYCLRGATLGKTAIIEQFSEGAVASSLVIVRLATVVCSRYAYFYLTSPVGRELIYRFDNGSAQPNLSANSVKLYVFPLPPLAEQKRIVAKVEELMALVDRLEAKEKAARATASRLLEATVAELAGGAAA